MGKIRSFFTVKRKKLVLIIILVFFLTQLSAPALGKTKPTQPNLNHILTSLQQATTNFTLPQFNPFTLLSNATKPINPSARNIPVLLPTSQPATRVSPVPNLNMSPTSTPPMAALPTPRLNQPSSVQPTTSNPFAQPTTIKTPKPTKTPKKPTPTPFKLTNPRPGKNFQDTANIVGKVVCIPPAMLMATLDNEYGAWKAEVEADWANRNTYKGSDPHDNPGSAVVPSVVVMQMMEDTWHRIKPILASKYFNTSEMSLEVTFDAMAAGGYHLRNVSLAMQDKVSCDDWPAKYILYGACRYNGACAAGSTTYNQYTYNVCNAYNRYTKGPKKNCNQ